jgi:hypothetical protein
VRIFILCLLFSFSSFALHKEGYIRFNKGETILEAIQKRFDISDSQFYDGGIQAEVLKLNPKFGRMLQRVFKKGGYAYVKMPITQYADLERGYLDRQTLHRLAIKVKKAKTPGRAPASTQSNKVEKTIERLDLPDNEKEEVVKEGSKRKSNLNVFYTASQGDFTQESSTLRVTSTQNSPFTLGIAATQRSDSNYSYSESFYISRLEGAVSSTQEEVTIPMEWGANLYVNYLITGIELDVYGGFDLERFSTFNVDELPTGQPLTTIEHTLYYATFGISKAFKAFNQNMFFKLSYSSSLSSSSSRQSLTSNEAVAGSKMIFFLSWKFSESWSAHLLYKKHSLTGPTTLSISRTGLGVAYHFF